MPLRTSIVAGLLLMLAGSCAAAQELLPLEHVVLFNNNGRQPPTPNVYPLFRLSERFALVEDFYMPANLDATIAEDLRRSGMLYIGQYSDESPLFADPELCRSIRSHLETGGLIFFDYNTGHRGIRFYPETVAFLKSVGATPPDDFHPGYGTSRFEEADAHGVLAGPAPIGGKTTGHYGWWQKWSPKQIVLARDRDEPSNATLLLQDEVLGKGTIVFSQLPSVFRTTAGVPFEFVKNVVDYAYGSEEASP